MPLLAIFGNILIPALSGIILFIYFLYFAFIEESKSLSTGYFTIFLISFSVFLFGRPVQILSGAHPVPLIINNIRSFLFSAVTIPMVILADFSQPGKEQRPRLLAIIIPGIILGLVYCLFNTLTTIGSETIFAIGSYPVFDSATPALTPPFYGREVTNGVYMILAAILFIDSAGKIRRVRRLGEKEGLPLRKIYYYNTGKIIFALTFFTGALLHQWWIYYVGSLASVAFLGYGVALDIQENRRRMQKVIAYIREDLIQDISIDVNKHQQVSDMLELLHIPGDINTFVVLKESALNHTGNSDSLLRDMALILDRILGKNQSLLMPMGTDMVGICLFIPREADAGRSETIRICEFLKQSLEALHHYDFGIGRSYAGLEDLKESYHEAVNAVEYAKAIEGGQVIHITDLQDEENRREYPLKEKNAFLAAVKMGDRDKALEQLQRLMELIYRYGGDTDTLIKVRLYELLGTMIESAISGGGDVDSLLELSDKLFAESAIIRNQSQLIEWLKARTVEIISIVADSHSNRSKSIVRKAQAYIKEHYAEAISVKDVADAVCISESYFKSIFKKSSGFSYSEYLTNVRMEEAKNLLNNTEKSVMEISLDVGYHNPNSFSSLFKRETGMTPTQYKSAAGKK
ncbi:MAG: helix-turn-helix domain-containing protein [Spirochaetales bacterium]|nr:helix-turn-helix domain-containing protein [Spirochaetales bacterium]